MFCRIPMFGNSFWAEQPAEFKVTYHKWNDSTNKDNRSLIGSDEQVFVFFEFFFLFLIRYLTLKYKINSKKLRKLQNFSNRLNV